jgi:glycosyltransferase involved in cell wall biosynthesis
MRLLWSVANWKRTGPVEPSLDLASALASRGHEVLVVTGRPVGTAPDESGEAAEVRGLTRLSLGLRLGKHRALFGDGRDVRRLAAHLSARPPDIVQTTLANDHRILAGAVAVSGHAVPVARLWFEDGAKPPPSWEAALLRSAGRTFVFGDAAERTLLAAGVAPERLARVAPPIDAPRLRRAATGVAAARERLLSGGGGLLVGLVARVQAHRRFDLLWGACARLKSAGVRFRVVVIGRGSGMAEVAEDPVAAAGLGDVVAFPGYLRGSDYASALAALDVQLLLVPGSDPTCRALREGMALGVPSIATRRGLLPDIVDDEETGLLVDETPDALEGAIARLAADEPLRRRLAAGAGARAADEFSPGKAAERLEAAYAELARPR